MSYGSDTWTPEYKPVAEFSYAYRLGIYDVSTKTVSAGNAVTSVVTTRRAVTVTFTAQVAAARAVAAQAAALGLNPTAMAAAMTAVIANLGSSLAVLTPTGIQQPTIGPTPTWGNLGSDSGFCLGSSFCGAGAIVVLVLLILVGLGLLVGAIVVATSMQSSAPAHQERDPPQKLENVEYEVADTGIQPNTAYNPEKSISHAEVELQPVAPTPAVTAALTADVQLTAEVVQVLEMYFDRYDLDRSGTLNSPDELRQIGVNLAFNHPGFLRETDPGALQSVCDSISVSSTNPMTLPQFLEWFKASLYKPPN